MRDFAGERLAHTREVGFPLYTDVSNRLMAYLCQQPVPDRISVADVRQQFTIHPSEEKVATSFEVDVPEVTLSFDDLDVDSSAAALFFVSRQLSGQLLTVTRGTNTEHTTTDFHQQFGISDQDKDRARDYYYDYGFDDTEFTWHFAPAVANAMVGRGVITKAEKSQLTLGDWANVIGSGWFGSVIHDLTSEKFGAYGIFGKNLADYGADEFLFTLENQANMHEYPPIVSFDAFDFQTVTEYGRTYQVASLKAELKRELRAGMDDGVQSVETETRGRTYGCPVARYAGVLSVDPAHYDAHLQNLIDRGEITLFPTSQPGRARFKQKYTAIDHSLMALAGRIDAYDHAYGTPLIHHDGSNTTVKHRYLRSTDVLCRPAD